MAGYNKVIIQGFVGGDGELKQAGNSEVLNFTLATSFAYKDKQGEKVEKTEWHRVVLFGTRASGLAQYIKKGTPLLVEGRLQTDSYEKDGVKHFSTKVVANDVVFTGKKEGGSTKPAGKTSAPAQPDFGGGFGDGGSFDDQDVPF